MPVTLQVISSQLLKGNAFCFCSIPRESHHCSWSGVFLWIFLHPFQTLPEWRFWVAEHRVSWRVRQTDLCFPHLWKNTMEHRWSSWYFATEAIVVPFFFIGIKQYCYLEKLLITPHLFFCVLLPQCHMYPQQYISLNPKAPIAASHLSLLLFLSLPH